ncbi:MAG: hypothetical protein IRZ13_14830 [Acetobacteraceae bacterium]|nr:hypothetical protein [Acetobacteraceae bacterium]
MQPTDPRRIAVAENTGYLALTRGGGNCQYQSGATFLVLKAAEVRPGGRDLHLHRGTPPA